MSRNYENELSVRIGRVVWIAVLIFFGLIVIFGSVYTIQSGQEGVLLTFNKADLYAKTDGLHFKFPLVQKIVKFDVKTQKYVTKATAASSDLQIVSSELAVNYRIVAGSTPKIFTEVGAKYEDRVIQPLVQEVVKATTAQFSAEDLITKRPAVKEQIKERLRSLLAERDILVEEISLTDFDFSSSFNEAIEQKVTAEQLKLKAERDLERIEIEAKQIEATAIGQRNAEIAKAEGDAKRISLVQEELQRSPEYIEWLAVSQWDGILPKVTGGAVPFVDVMSFGTSEE